MSDMKKASVLCKDIETEQLRELLWRSTPERFTNKAFASDRDALDRIVDLEEESRRPSDWVDWLLDEARTESDPESLGLLTVLASGGVTDIEVTSTNEDLIYRFTEEVMGWRHSAPSDGFDGWFDATGAPVYEVNSWLWAARNTLIQNPRLCDRAWMVWEDETDEAAAVLATIVHRMEIHPHGAAE